MFIDLFNLSYDRDIYEVFAFYFFYCIFGYFMSGVPNYILDFAPEKMNDFLCNAREIGVTTKVRATGSFAAHCGGTPRNHDPWSKSGRRRAAPTCAPGRHQPDSWEYQRFFPYPARWHLFDERSHGAASSLSTRSSIRCHRDIPVVAPCSRRSRTISDLGTLRCSATREISANSGSGSFTVNVFTRSR